MSLRPVAPLIHPFGVKVMGMIQTTRGTRFDPQICSRDYLCL